MRNNLPKKYISMKQSKYKHTTPSNVARLDFSNQGKKDHRVTRRCLLQKSRNIAK